ncbi:Terminal oxygenase KshA [Enhygromyxa salina]|uniref:Terminal oxygenase KshA n=1 Tax=Enhygromyxa salina TaxID=215803 RepID=A0A0C2D8T1_9BACT|nr:Rieske 2Fe-2S domain-containing protein [Enhygromyxa salina]KIG16382.1 Terminal oxygenase KshA [Enhygromyxa salina]
MTKYASLPNPDGWFAVCFSTELAAGQLQARRLFDRDVVVFRTESGQVAVIDAHCPHMGAHLGHGGRVDGDAVRCPFHGFRFAPDGACISTPYATKIPPKCATRSWHTCERNGVILVWHDQRGRPPSFQIPTYDLDTWLPMQTQTWELSTHPQETTENSVDLGHLGEVHHYRDVEVLEPLKTEGAYLTIRYGMSRSGFGLSRTAENRAEFRVHVHGLGFSHVEVHEQRRDVRLRFWVLCTPTEADKCELRAACTTTVHARPYRASAALGLLPRGVASRVIQKFAFDEFCHDLTQDFEVWRNKLYVDPPALAKGDGPVGRYRSWCRQFYPQLPLVAKRAS